MNQLLSSRRNKPGLRALFVAVGAALLLWSPNAMAQSATLSVREKSGAPMRVWVDGKDVGATPYEGPIAPGKHSVVLKSATKQAPEQSIEVAAGGRVELSLEARAKGARLAVRTSDGLGTIYVDGVSVGDGTYEGDVEPGVHSVVVKRQGFRDYAKRIDLSEGETLVDNVTLATESASVAPDSSQAAQRLADGIYGGLHAALLMMPWGSDNTPEASCDSLGAPSCQSSMPWGAAMAGYLGYAFEPVGIELFMGFKGDRATPKAEFDGVNGSGINPFVAQPARTEEFLFGRGGAFGGIRARTWIDTAHIRWNLAMGMGLGWQKMAMKRTTTSAQGADNVFSPDPVSYFTPVVSVDVSAQIPMGKTTRFCMGAMVLIENVGQRARTQPDGTQMLSAAPDGTPPTPIATPAYDMAAGPQAYIGPYVGVQFGP